MDTQERPSPARRRHRFGYGAKLLVSLATLAMLAVCFEVGLRVLGYQPRVATALSTFFQYDQATGWRGRPLAASRFATNNFDAYIAHGPDGFRLSENETTAAADKPRPVTWCVGDSMTWGWGVSNGQTFVDHLNRSFPQGHVYRNLGHSGFSAIQEFLLLRDLFEGGDQPDRVLIVFCPNDLAENVDGADQDPGRPFLTVRGDKVELQNYPVPPPSSFRVGPFLKHYSLAFNFLAFYGKTAANALRNLRGSGAIEVPPGIPDSHWKAMRFAYSSIKELCAKHGVDLAIVYLPERGITGEYQAKGLAEYQQTRRDGLLRLTQELGLPVFDLTVDFLEYMKRPDIPRSLSLGTDSHFNPTGNRLVADALMSHLEKRVH